MSIPAIDGHFWIVRDGEIVDQDFKQYDFIRKVQGCVPEIMVYKEAPNKTQELMLTIFKNETQKVFKSKKWDTVMKQVVYLTQLSGIDKPMFQKCYQNCIIEQYYNGGEIKFGSMGFKKKNGDTWWEFGGEHHKTIKDFR